MTLSSGARGASRRIASSGAPRARNKRAFRRLFRPLAAIAAVTIAGYALPCLLVVRALTKPRRLAVSRSPTEIGFPFEDATFLSREDLTPLRGWWIPGMGPQTVILIHGKDSVRDDPDLGFLELAAALVAAGYNVLMFDLRGHGESGAGRITLGWRETRDVLGAIDYAHARGIASDQIALVGFSMGAAASLRAALLDPVVGAVVADGVWPDLAALLTSQIPKQSRLPRVYAPGVILAVRLLFGVDVHATSPAADVRTLSGAARPLLLIHESDDQYTDPPQARQLDHAAANNPRASTWTVPGAPHVQANTALPAEYQRRLLAFLAGSIGLPSPQRAAAVTSSSPPGAHLGYSDRCGH